MWKPLFMYREGDYLITFMASEKEPKYRGMAMGQPFQFSAGANNQKYLTLKKFQVHGRTLLNSTTHLPDVFAFEIYVTPT